jgi:hypothetical protein
MMLDFDIGSVAVTEFGVGRDDDDNQTFCLMAVDKDVQMALREIVSATWQKMQDYTNNPPMYEPSEKYQGTEYLYLPLNDDLAESIRDLYRANNLPLDANALANSDTVFCYFARLADKHGRRLTALRRATQFKGVIKSRLIRLATDALKLIKDQVFKLDSDFDLLADSKNVHILRPSGFEFMGKLQGAVLKAVSNNVAAIQKDLAFVDFETVQKYASAHTRAARYLASIRAQNETKNIDKKALKKLCEDMGVELKESKGKLVVDSAHIIGFLEVLDRRRYELRLVKEKPERFRADSRKRLEK